MQRLVLVLLLWSLPAFAAPICFNHAGDTVHCNVPSAMPVGWEPSAEEHQRWLKKQPPTPSANVLLGTAIALLAFLAMIGLMPEFDGRDDDDWKDPDQGPKDPAAPGNTTGLS
jgi:hypothetical protein